MPVFMRKFLTCFFFEFNFERMITCWHQTSGILFKSGFSYLVLNLWMTNKRLYQYWVSAYIWLLYWWLLADPWGVYFGICLWNKWFHFPTASSYPYLLSWAGIHVHAAARWTDALSLQSFFWLRLEVFQQLHLILKLATLTRITHRN